MQFTDFKRFIVTFDGASQHFVSALQSKHIPDCVCSEHTEMRQI